MRLWRLLQTKPPGQLKQASQARCKDSTSRNKPEYLNNELTRISYGGAGPGIRAGQWAWRRWQVGVQEGEAHRHCKWKLMSAAQVSSR